MSRLLTSTALPMDEIENKRAIGRGEYRKALEEEPELREAIERDRDLAFIKERAEK